MSPSFQKFFTIASMAAAVRALPMAAPVADFSLVGRSSCDYGTPDPTGWTTGMDSQWCAMITNEVSGLTSKEDPTTVLPTVEAEYKQANIQAQASSALPVLSEITSDSEARAALTQMKANYPATGSMDLTQDNIQTVYADAINSASGATGVPASFLSWLIWTESKGHPFVYGGLVQMDYVAWGQMVDADPSLKNRYLPADSIMAAAKLMQSIQKQYSCGDWTTCYYGHYAG